MSAPRYRAVLFDMDGTLVDTLPDIVTALNAALGDLDLHALDSARIATLIGNGPRILARRALEAQANLSPQRRAACIDALLDGYARHYARCAASDGRLYPGTLACLRDLAAQGRKLAVVTNALQRLAETVLARFGIAPCFDIVVGGDTVSHNKPHPEALWKACNAFGVAAADALMVGDSLNDVAAARAAGTAIVCVAHGYDQGHSVHALGVDVIDALPRLPAWLAVRESGGGAAAAAGERK